MTFDEQLKAHHKWLEDSALRMICVLALDRFGDFVTGKNYLKLKGIHFYKLTCFFR